MEILNFFPSTKKNLEEKEQRDRIDRIDENNKEEMKKEEIEKARIKIIQPSSIKWKNSKIELFYSYLNAGKNNTYTIIFNV